MGGGEGLEPVQTLVPIAANGGKDPEVINAAACTFLHEGRKPDIRCALHIGLLCGTLLPFAGNIPMAAFASKQEQPSADYPGFKAFQTSPSTIATNDWISSYIF